jgi:hypothetical protein
MEKALHDAVIRNAVNWAHFSTELITFMLVKSEGADPKNEIDNADEESARRLVELILLSTKNVLEPSNGTPQQIERRLRHVLFHGEAIMCWKNIEPTDEEFEKSQALEKRFDEIMTNTIEQKPTNTPWWAWMCIGAFVWWLISSF